MRAFFAVAVAGLATLLAATPASALTGVAGPVSGSAPSALEVRGSFEQTRAKGAPRGAARAVRAPARRAVPRRVVTKRVVRPGRVVRRPVVRRTVVVRRWNRRPYYGRVIAGVALGAIIVATAVAVAPSAPDPSLCWYWSDNSRARGYWDYCS